MKRAAGICLLAFCAVTGMSPGLGRAQADVDLDVQLFHCPELDALEKQPGYEQKYAANDPKLLQEIEILAEVCSKRTQREEGTGAAKSYDPFEELDLEKRNKNTPKWFKI